MVALGAPVIWGLGLLYSAITSAPLSLACYKIYCVLVRTPGARVTEETSFPATVLMNFAFLLHVFAFAAGERCHCGRGVEGRGGEGSGPLRMLFAMWG